MTTRFFRSAAASLLIAGVLAGAGARAQTTVGGIVDVFAERTSTPGRADTRLDSSGLGVSRLVVKSLEQVGPELYVGVYLEGRIAVDTGTASNGGGLFNRMSHISLLGKHLKLTVGRQYSPHLLLLASQFDIFETSFWATPYAIFQGLNRYTIIPGAVLVQVDTEWGRPVLLSAMWADRPLDPGLAPAGQQHFLSALVKLTDQLALGLNTVDDEHFSMANPHARLLLGGFNYDAGRWRVAGGIQKLDLLQTGERINEYCIGAGLIVTPGNLVQVSHARTYAPGHAERSAQVTGVALVHQLSLRTALYGSVGYLGNKAESSGAFDVPVAPGASSRNVMVGIKHNF